MKTEQIHVGCRANTAQKQEIVMKTKQLHVGRANTTQKQEIVMKTKQIHVGCRADTTQK